MEIFFHEKFKNTCSMIKSNPILVYLGVLSGNKYWISPLQNLNNYSEILFIKQGFGTVLINEKYYDIKPGDIIIYNKNTFHKEEFKRKIDDLMIYFFAVTNLEIEGIEKGSIIHKEISPVIASDQYEELFIKYCELMIEECRSAKLGYEIVTNNIFKSMFIFLLRLINNKYNLFSKKESIGLEHEVKKFIEANFSNKLTLQDISDHFNYNPYYLSHCFRNLIGKSPINYLIKYRVEQAKKLLITTNHPIQHIAELVGYDSGSYFSMLFKKHTTFSPSEYRNLNSL